MRNKLVAVFVAATLSQAALAQQGQQAAGPEELEQVVITGTRVANRSALDTAVPVDVVPASALQNLGVAEINQALSVALPSFTFPRPGLADGTDTVRPASLRGLAPDQTLVLVNGKRRHTAALVNVNGTVGRGSAAVDLNTIPNVAVRGIEVLRDGASAQYGSDAIAGVINLRMREDSSGGELGVSYGWRDSTYENLTGTPPAGATWSAPAVLKRSRSDGETLTVSGWKGFALGDSGFLTVAAEYKDAERTERGGWDFRSQYARTSTGAFDPREATFDRFSQWYGEPELKQTTVFVNAGIDVNDNAEFYASASYQDRSAVSAGFQRLANDPSGRNIASIYPDGFLPQIAPDVTDYALSAGMRWGLGNWDMDASLGYGYNEMMFTIQNTLNRSLGPTSKTVFDAGGYDYDQLVFNLSGVRGVEVAGLASPLNVAIGLEARREGYSITAGEPDSYRNGGARLPLGSPGCTSPTAADTAAGGCPTPSGAQVFPGFRPANVVDKSRNAVGAYIDLEANITEKFLASAAIRAEDYSDFGSNVSGKISGRYDIADGFAIRGSYSTGFRAPSLQQQYFATTSTNFINGVPFDITTFPATDPVAAALGAKPLDSEDSTNFSVGAVLQFDRASLTIDAYRIELDNRIVLSENLTSVAVRNFLTAQGFVGIGGGRFFINGVDTVTKGVDVVFNYPLVTDSAGRFDITATANFNETVVTKVPATPQLSALSPAPILFDRGNRLTFERGTPKDKYSLSVAWSLGDFGLTARATRYGEVLSPQNAPTVTAPDFLMTPKTLVDLEARYAFGEHFKFAVGADNVLDEYPDPLPPGLNTTGATSFSNLAPFGRSGRYVYGRVTFAF
ncbi:MAG: TonB-dependent receptor plug domain-containing protein [Gammaproteobacteria bacterium]|jgi:iron complex outermembrane receptor protein